MHARGDFFLFCLTAKYTTFSEKQKGMVLGFQCECTIVSDGRLMQESNQYCPDSHVILNEWLKEHNKGPFKKYVRSSISTFDLLPPLTHMFAF